MGPGILPGGVIPRIAIPGCPKREEKRNQMSTSCIHCQYISTVNDHMVIYLTTFRDLVGQREKDAMCTETNPI